MIDLFIDEMTVSVSIARAIASAPPEESEGDGGYLFVLGEAAALAPNARLIYGFKVGDIDPAGENIAKIAAATCALRLDSNRDHLSSWESDSNDVGAAVRGTKLILAFAGLSRSANEAAVLHLALALGELDRASADQIALKSANRTYTRIWQSRDPIS
ncbi:MAG: hypothetical protein EON58_13245 [Alphaproteobacteria bacterium]|nr:MAG: hypothetical protein EON58_13245 [Alphaproteobacteria bacterium]